jgi:hypothetical protein
VTSPLVQKGRDLLRRSAVATAVVDRRREARLDQLGPGRAPDWVGVGVQKAGTTRWFDLITAHPAAGGPGDGRKEQHYFDRFGTEPWTELGAARYHRAFPTADARRLGEWTPRYLHDPWTPALLALAAPEARILVVLRDPLARLRSGLAHTARRSTAAGADRAVDAFTRGLYVAQLERLFAHFDREQVLVLQFERCIDAPAPELARTYRHLGLDPFVPPAEVLERTVYPAPAPTRPLPAAQVDAARDAYCAEAPALAALVPDLDLGLWPSVSSSRRS